MVVAEGCTTEGVPELLSVGVVTIGDAIAGELAVESLLRREGFLFESGPAVHVLVGLDPIAEQEGTPLEVLLVVCCDAHVLRITGFHQSIQA